MEVLPGFDRRWILGALAGAAGILPRGLARATLAGSRFAAIDWGAAETLLAAGIAPIALSERELYRQWLPEIPLGSDVIDLGSRTEPNLELLASLAPDRIFISNWQRNLAGQLQRIAPTETIAIVDAKRQPFQNAVDALLQVGRSGGVSATAHASGYLGQFERALASYADLLAGTASPPVYIGVLHEDGARIFVYGGGSWVHDILTRLGLRNALKWPTSLYGNALLDLAQLAATPNATLLYLDQGERTRRAERRLRSSTLWRNLPMVAGGRTLPIAPFYALGGVPSMWLCARVVTQALLASRKATANG